MSEVSFITGMLSAGVDRKIGFLSAYCNNPKREMQSIIRT